MEYHLPIATVASYSWFAVPVFFTDLSRSNTHGWLTFTTCYYDTKSKHNSASTWLLVKSLILSKNCSYLILNTALYLSSSLSLNTYNMLLRHFKSKHNSGLNMISGQITHPLEKQFDNVSILPSWFSFSSSCGVSLSPSSWELQRHHRSFSAAPWRHSGTHAFGSTTNRQSQWQSDWPW